MKKHVVVTSIFASFIFSIFGNVAQPFKYVDYDIVENLYKQNKLDHLNDEQKQQAYEIIAQHKTDCLRKQNSFYHNIFIPIIKSLSGLLLIGSGISIVTCIQYISSVINSDAWKNIEAQLKIDNLINIITFKSSPFKDNTFENFHIIFKEYARHNPKQAEMLGITSLVVTIAAITLPISAYCYYKAYKGTRQNTLNLKHHQDLIKQDNEILSELLIATDVASAHL